MTFDPTEDYGDDKVLLTVEGEYAGRELTAFCSPDSDGAIHFNDGEQIGEFQERNGAPFSFDVVLSDNVYLQEGQGAEMSEELGDAFDEQFHAKVDAVHDKISDSDDPLDTILDLEPDELVVEPIEDSE